MEKEIGSRLADSRVQAKSAKGLQSRGLRRMEKKMETTIVQLGIILRIYGDNGKENGNYYLGLWGGRVLRVQVLFDIILSQNHIDG